MLIRRAREAAGRSPRECATFLGISRAAMAAYEDGRREPTLVELEAIAHYLGAPVSRLLDENILLRSESQPPFDLKTTMQVRGHIIGARLKQARMNKGETLKQAAQAAGIKPGQLNNYELGQRQAPISALEALMAHYELTLDQLLDLGIGPIGEAQLRLQQHAHFDALPEEVRAFISDPASLSYLQAALHLSRMPKEELLSAAKVLELVGEA